MNKFRLDRDNSLLFIVDVQERLVPAMKNGEKAVENILKLLKSAEIMDIDTIATEQYPKGLGNTINGLRDYIDDENVFSKIEFTACVDSVKGFLKESSKKNIIVAGMETHVCVYQTVRDLLSLGYNVFVVRDAVASRTEENFLNGLDLFKDMGAVVTNTETVLFDLLKKAGTDEFKAISKLIK